MGTDATKIDIDDVLAVLNNLMDSTKPRIRSTANGFRYCVSCGKEWSHDSPKEEHKQDCALIAAKQLLKELKE